MWEESRMIDTRHFIAALLMLPLACPATAQTPLKVTWQGDDTMHLTLQLTESKDLGRDYAVFDTPVLSNQRGDTLRLQPVVFRGKRHNLYVQRARFFGTDTAERTGYTSKHEALLGDTIVYEADLTRSEHPWLWNGDVRVSVDREKDGCCDVEDLASTSAGSFAYVAPVTECETPKPDVVKVEPRPEDSNPLLRNFADYNAYDGTDPSGRPDGMFFVYYPIDRTVLLRDFGDNAATLDSIVKYTRMAVNEPSIEIKKIQIIGLASIEGAQERNRRLANRRADSLRRYVQQNIDLPDSLFDCTGGGEAWAEFRTQVAASDMRWRDQLLHIIDTEKDADYREHLIKTLDGGKAYRYLVDNVLGDQRRACYLRIYYVQK